MAYLYGLILLIFAQNAFAQTTPVGYVDLAGWIKGADGTYSRAPGNDGGTRATSTTGTNGTLSTSTSVQVQTSKGLQSLDIKQTATPDLTRVGAAVGKFVQKVGPVAATVAVAELVCSLSNICNIDGVWMAEAVDPHPDMPNSYPSSEGKWNGWDQTDGTTSYYPTPATACADTRRLTVNVGSGATYDHTVMLNASTYQCYGKINGNVYYASNTSRIAGCAPQYTLSGDTCMKTGLQDAHPATAQDFTNKQAQLGDKRFLDALSNAGEDIPTGIPTVNADQKKRLGVETVTTKDAAGNPTGKEETTTEIEPVDAGTSDKPGRVIIKETVTKVKYDVNNNVVSSTSTTNYNQNPEQPKGSFSIQFDNVPASEMRSYQVPNTFSYTSWGGGTCPAPIALNLSVGQFEIPTQPVCDVAEMLNPFVLMLASVVSLYIIAGVKMS